MNPQRTRLKKRSQFRRFIKARPTHQNILLEWTLMALGWLPSIIIYIGLALNRLPSTLNISNVSTIYYLVVASIISIWALTGFLSMTIDRNKEFDVPAIAISNISMIASFIITIGLVHDLAIPWNELAGQLLIVNIVVAMSAYLILAIFSQLNRTCNSSVGIIFGLILGVLTIWLFGATDIASIFVLVMKGLGVYLAIGILIFVIFLGIFAVISIFDNSSSRGEFITSLFFYPAMFSCFLFLFFMGASMFIVVALSAVVNLVMKTVAGKWISFLAMIVVLVSNLFLVWLVIFDGWQIL